MSDKKTFFYSFYTTLLGILAVVTLSYMLFLAPLQNDKDSAQSVVGQTDKLPDINIIACVRESERALPQNFAYICISPARGQIAVTNLPQQMTVKFAGREDTLSQCYGYAGILQVCQSLQNEGIDCDYYMDMTLQGLASVIDLYGTFMFEVPQNIYSYDDAGLLRFKQGLGISAIGGAQAVGILQYNTLEDSDRTTLWLDMIKSALTTYFCEYQVQNLPQSFAKMSGIISTNITVMGMKELQKNMTAILAVDTVSIVCPQVYELDDLPLILEDYF